MSYEEFKAVLSAINLEELGARTGLSIYGCGDGRVDGYNGRMNLFTLNPYFGYSVHESSHGISMNWGVTNMSWGISQNEWNQGQFHFSMTITQRNYKDLRIEEQDEVHWSQGLATFTQPEKRELTEKQRDAIAEFVTKWAEQQRAKIAERYERGKKELSVEELEKECERVANEILAGKTNKYGDKLRAKLCVGKRTCDTSSKPYTALCIECAYKGGWDYMAGFVFGKDKYGINQMKYMRPLCGETSMEFDWDTFKQYVQSELR